MPIGLGRWGERVAKSPRFVLPPRGGSTLGRQSEFLWTRRGSRYSRTRRDLPNIVRNSYARRVLSCRSPVPGRFPAGAVHGIFHCTGVADNADRCQCQVLQYPLRGNVFRSINIYYRSDALKRFCVYTVGTDFFILNRDREECQEPVIRFHMNVIRKDGWLKCPEVQTSRETLFHRVCESSTPP